MAIIPDKYSSHLFQDDHHQGNSFPKDFICLYKSMTGNLFFAAILLMLGMMEAIKVESFIPSADVKTGTGKLL